jgi:hypothetical protein
LKEQKIVDLDKLSEPEKNLLKYCVEALSLKEMQTWIKAIVTKKVF